jgi:hypothetical protein
MTAENAEERGGRGVDENLIGETVLGCALSVHKALGPGLLGYFETRAVNAHPKAV